MVRAAVAVLGAALVLGAGAGAVSAGERGSGALFFRMPSGNIYCAYEHYSFAPIALRCEIASMLRPMPRRPKSCRDAVWGAGYYMHRTGRPTVLCISDTIYTARARVFRYGTRWRGGGFTCWSRTTGLRCRNRVGHGFFLSRERSYRF